ncbi:coiled-coil domain-containing protein 150 isoform X2 [Hoplias malabaricus]|uniref:coiled-coil domain-containing protein 150 isoform X2 n=1 Tax=Hoplias malabaricus TaxID=27720 RepID=UPI003462A58B
MSQPVIAPLNVGATASESLSLLQQRLLVAEEQTDRLMRDVKTLGTPGTVESQQETLRITSSPSSGVCMRPLSPVRVQQVLGGDDMLWRHTETLVRRVCRLETVLHTIRLTIFRLETERQLQPSHTARLEEQLASLQEQIEEEQRSSRREVMRLREQLEEAQLEANKLRQQLDVLHCSKMDIAVTADELKTVQVQMSEKLQQKKAELAEETAGRLEAERSLRALLQRLEEMEAAVEREREQVSLLQADCHALRNDGQETRAELQEKEELIERLQKEREQLRDQLERRDTLVSELTRELQSVRMALQKQQQENSRLLKDEAELKMAADKVQALNDQLETQCSDLSSALCSLTAENSRLQKSLKTEQECVTQRLKEQDLLLDAAKKSIQSELQGALADRLLLQKELDTLRADHAKLQQSSALALDTAVSHQSLLDKSIERLRAEVNGSVKERENLQREREEIKTEMTGEVCKLERERNALQIQLSELQVEMGEISSTLQKKEDENRGLMGKLSVVQHQQNQVQKMGEELKALGAESTKQNQTNCSLESMCTQKSAALYDVLDTAQWDRRLSPSLERVQQHTLRQREVELLKAREEIGHLEVQVDALKQQLLTEKHHGKKSTLREVAELKKALEDASGLSHDLSRANQELRWKVSELEKLVSNQKSRIKAQKAQLKQHLDDTVAQRAKDIETEMKILENSRNEYERKCYEQSQSLLQVRTEMAELQAQLNTLSSKHQGALQAERNLTRKLQEKYKMLEKVVAKLREERDETEQKMREVSHESQQISENLQEAHVWFRSRFHSLNSEVGLNHQGPEEYPESWGDIKDSALNSPALAMDKVSSNETNTGSVLVCVAEPEMKRWTSALQRWETKRELAHIASGYTHRGRTHSLT